MKHIFYILLMSLVFSSCGNTENKEHPSDYEMISDSFEGMPHQSEIKPLLESVMAKYNYSKTQEHILGVANMLVVLRKSSVVGVTEMDILKHMYQSGDSNNTIDKQAAISATILEMSK